MMRFLLLSTIHPAHDWKYWSKFYAERPGLLQRSYSEQKAAWDEQALGWADYYSHAMSSLGYEVREVAANIEPMQKTWAQENGVPFHKETWLRDIAFAQIQKFQADVLFIEDYSAFSEQWVKDLRSQCRSIRLLLGFVESSIPETGVWRYSDVAVSCGPEVGEILRKKGYRVEQLHYGFDPRILSRVGRSDRIIDVSFLGQIVRAGRYHLERERFLLDLVKKIDVQIFSTSADFGFWDDLDYLVRAGLFASAKILRDAGVSDTVVNNVPLVGRAARWRKKPMRPVSPKLKPFLKPAVFGLEMFQTLLDSKITLNKHIDSSPTHASNYRLFEATGIGSCLVTDWKENLQELFDPEKEVLTYRSVEECVEKIKWLLDHSAEREAIARAGQARTLKDHTFSQRAVRFDEIIRKNLGR